VWPTLAVSPDRVARVLHLRGVRDMVVVNNSSGRAKAVRVLTSRGWKQLPGSLVRKEFKLGSTDFEVKVLTLDALPRAVYDSRARVSGWLRGLGRARLQLLTDQGWKTVRQIHASPSGHFRVSLPALRSTQLRLAYNGVAGGAVPLSVTPRISLSAEGTKLRVRVIPRLPLQVQRLTRRRWTSVAHSTGGFDRSLRPGSYRVAILGGSSYLSSTTKPVALRAKLLK
jgi:hypothetical protein